MRLVFLCDIHGAYDQAEAIARAENSADLLILGGDMTHGGDPAAVRALVARLAPHADQLLAVAGNMDPPAIDQALTADSISLHGQGVRIDDLGLFGVSGGPLALGTPNELPEAEIERLATEGHQQIADAPVRLFVPHTPPRDTRLDRISSGQSVGSQAVRKVVERLQPDALLCGHIHEARGTDQLGPTLMANGGSAREGYYSVVVIQNGQVQIELCHL